MLVLAQIHSARTAEQVTSELPDFIVFPASQGELLPFVVCQIIDIQRYCWLCRFEMNKRIIFAENDNLIL